MRELLEEFHPYIRTESGILTPLDIIPQGYEMNGLKGEFMTAVMQSRLELASRINANLVQECFKISARETLQAVPLSVPGLTKPLIQIIDGHTIKHNHVVTFDAQSTNKNMDFNTDLLFAVRVHGASPKDFFLKDGETDQKTDALLDRVIFFGDPDELKRAVTGEIIQFHPGSDMSKPVQFSPAFRPILMESGKVTRAALDCAL